MKSSRTSDSDVSVSLPIGDLPIDDVSLFLVLDGSIVPVVEHGDEARASVACRAVLRRARDNLRGRLAILSHRTISAVDSAVDGLVTCVSGLQGRQRRSPFGEVILKPRHSRVAAAAVALEALARGRSGLSVAKRRSSVALRYRGAEAAESAILELAERLAESSGLRLSRGDGFIELSTPEPSKAAAVHLFMTERPFLGTRPIVIGAGASDEAAFATAQDRLFGVGMLVGEGGRTRALGRFRDHVAVLSWICRSLDAKSFDIASTVHGDRSEARRASPAS